LKQPPIRWCHVIDCTGPRRQLADPQLQGHWWWHNGRQTPYLVLGPHSPHWSTAWGALLHHPSYLDYTRRTSHVPITLTAAWPAGYLQSRVWRHVAGWHSLPFQEFLVFCSTYCAQRGQWLGSLRGLQSTECLENSLLLSHPS
jgi:hypothetical protein